MRSLITKIKQFPWLYQQPLTKPPSLYYSPISDLFLWRKGENWTTFFELTNIASLFHDSPDELLRLSANTSVRVVIFDRAGNVINVKRINAPIHRRLTVNISELAVSSSDQFGTFSILHSSTPPAISNLGCMLAERGYVSYCFLGSQLRSFVHGNLDAVSTSQNEQIERLGGTSFFQREFRLQHELSFRNTYDIAVVNPSTSKLDVFCDVIDVDLKLNANKLSRSLFRGETIIHTTYTTLQSGGCHLFHVRPDSTPKRLRLRSRLVMARPLVFSLSGNSMDVFHG